MKQDTITRHDFEVQVMPLLPNLLRVASYLSGIEADAQDLVRASVVRAYRLWHKGEVITNCRVWIFRVMATAFAGRHAPDIHPSAATAVATDVDKHADTSGWVRPAAAPEPMQLPLSAISVEDVENAIRVLPDHLRLPVVLSLVEGCSYSDIGDVAGISVEMVRTRLREGRTMMRRSLVDDVTVASMSDGSSGGVKGENMS